MMADHLWKIFHTIITLIPIVYGKKYLSAGRFSFSPFDLAMCGQRRGGKILAFPLQSPGTDKANRRVVGGKGGRLE
jgi:hypothetical protein